jgi:hypothetical protein
MSINLHAAWFGFLLGGLMGALQGLFFYKSDWLGGYGSWPRRMTRLGHIAFFGLGFINLGFFLTARQFPALTGLEFPSVLLVTGAVAMPTICYLSAWKPAVRHLFFLPVLSITGGVGIFAWRLITL